MISVKIAALTVTYRLMFWSESINKPKSFVLYLDWIETVDDKNQQQVVGM